MLKGELSTNKNMLKGELSTNKNMLKGELSTNKNMLKGELSTNKNMLKRRQLISSRWFCLGLPGQCCPGTHDFVFIFLFS